MLTKRQEKFCQEYVICGNASEAYRRVGYKPGRAKQTAWELRQKLEVAARIAELEKDTANRLGITHQFVLQNLKETAERCMQKVKILDAEGNSTGEWKFDASGANRALELLGKHLALFTDKSIVEIPSPVTVILNRGPGE